MTIKITRYLYILMSLALFSVSWEVFALHSKDFSDLGKVEVITNNLREREKLLRIIEHKKIVTKYNKEEVANFIMHIEKFSDLRLLSFTLKNQKDYAGFAVLKEIDNKLHIVLLFTAFGDRNKGWGSVLSRYVANQNHPDPNVNFLPDERLGTQWIADFLINDLNGRAADDPGKYQDIAANYDKVRLVQGLDFSYENPQGYKGLFDNSQYDEAKTMRADNISYAHARSPFLPFVKKPVLILTTGEPGAGKNAVFSQLIDAFPWFNNFEAVDIDRWSEENIRLALGERRMSELSIEERTELLRIAYDKAWDSFVIVRDEMLKARKDMIVFVTGRQENLIPDYKKLAGKYRIVVFNISVTKSKIVEKRVLRREELTNRPVPAAFAEKCAREIPIARYTHEHLYNAPVVNIINNWTEKKPVPLFFSSMACHSDRPCDKLWRTIVGEPTYWLRIELVPETRERLDYELKALVYGYNTEVRY